MTLGREEEGCGDIIPESMNVCGEDGCLCAPCEAKIFTTDGPRVAYTVRRQTLALGPDSWTIGHAFWRERWAFSLLDIAPDGQAVLAAIKEDKRREMTISSEERFVVCLAGGTDPLHIFTA